MTRRSPDARYRVEGTHACIDVSLRTAEQLFDTRDPAPFFERDLDRDAAGYISAAAEDIPRERALKLVLFIKEPVRAPLSSAVIEAAVRAHFHYEADRIQRELRQQRRFGRASLVAGLTALVLLLTLAALARRYIGGHAGEVFETGLVILGWVALWKPMDVLLYDWWPHVQQRTVFTRVASAPIDIRTGGTA